MLRLKVTLNKESVGVTPDIDPSTHALYGELKEEEAVLWDLLEQNGYAFDDIAAMISALRLKATKWPESLLHGTVLWVAGMPVRITSLGVENDRIDVTRYGEDKSFVYIPGSVKRVRIEGETAVTVKGWDAKKIAERRVDDVRIVQWRGGDHRIPIPEGRPVSDE